ENTLRALLGAFLFGGDDIMKKIKVLSGGEKARIALAKLILSKANFLILDEPTNHLDMQSVNLLVRVLQDFEGTFIFVSHDRFFVSQLANKIWWIEDHVLKEYPGTWEEYEYAKQAVKQKEAVAAKQQKQKEKTAKVVEKQKPVHTNDDAAKKKKKLTSQFQKLEEKIAQLKSEKEKVEAQLALPDIYSNAKTFQETMAKFTTVEKQLKEVTEEWEKVFEELEQL
ncbi:MAG: ABC-F family ATP-binding cassette domain-containing protein, partial [Bacteroidia bacterium]|nr:ABC-F family ATP-binding cassette domain-containing protein [Bacteroidia bacterium]